MTTSSNNVDTGIPKFPAITNIDENLFREFIKIYNSLDEIARAIEQYTGRRTVDQAERETIWLNGNVDNSYLANISKFRVPFAEDAVQGDIAYWDVAVNAVRVSSLQSLFINQMFGMVVNESVSAGQYGDVAVRGVIRYTQSFLTPGRWYRADRQLGDKLGLTIANWIQTAPRMSIMGVAISEQSFMLVPEFQTVD